MPDSTAAPVPPTPTLSTLREAAADCRACPLWEHATQTVFGAGGRNSAAMFVGEQPGDQEDRQGEPFVGPAGRILDEALALAGIDRRAAYVTNAVKHFKWEPRGMRRIHAKPSWSELTACRPWLEAELAVVRPTVLVCLGATAAQSLLGKQFRVTKQRGKMDRIEPCQARDGDDPPECHPPCGRPARGGNGQVRPGPEARSLSPVAGG